MFIKKHITTRRMPLALAALFSILVSSQMPCAAQADATPYWGQDIFIGGKGAYHTYRIPAMVVSTKGTILVFCEGRRESANDNGAIDVLLRRSTDCGRTWGPIVKIHGEAEGKVTVGNPVPIVDRITGDVHLLICRDSTKLLYLKSTDDGVSFSTPRDITEVVNEQCKRIGFQWVHMLTGPGHGMQMRNGRLVVPLKPAGPPQDGVRRRTGIIYSDDHGKTWKPGGIVPPTIGELSESTVIERSDGKLLINMRWHDGDYRGTSMSSDGGLTWSVPAPDKALPDPTNQGSMIACSDAFGSGDKRVVFANLDQPRTTFKDRARLTVRLSNDDGDTWDSSCLITPGPSGYSDLAISKDGSIYLSYENGKLIYREKISFLRFDLSLFKAKANVLPPGTVKAGIMLATLFRDDAVLQHGKPVPVWGWANPREKISISFAGQTVVARADEKGLWKTVLAPLAPSRNGAVMQVKGEAETVEVRNIVVGEVWIVTGQSNVEMSVADAANAQQEIAAARHPLIREFKVEKRSAETPEDFAGGSWSIASPQTAGAMGAIGYYYARALQQALDLPVGIINCSWTAVPIQAWLNPALSSPEKGESFAHLQKEWKEILKNYPQALAKFTTDMNAWKDADAKARTQGKTFTQRRPRRPAGPGHASTPCGIFNGMINPLAPFAMRGIIIMQGESDAQGATPDYYADYFRTMIEGFRRVFDQGDIPVYWAQLSSFREPSSGYTVRWAYHREAQARALVLPNTGQAVTIDIGDPADTRPKDKQTAAGRLALLALKRTYGKSLLQDAGPALTSVTPTKGGLRLAFENCPGGLVAKSMSPGGFELAGKDGKFQEAKAEVQGDAVLVTRPRLSNPVYVRYGWRFAGQAGLRNKDGLPSAPFRTDSIPFKESDTK